MADCIPTQSADLLRTFLELYWFAPSVALWRAVEARAVARRCFARPMLDFGCGHGRFAVAIFGTNRPIDAGCDLLDFQLKVARECGAYRTVAHADGHHLPYPGAAFATVFSNSVLEHIPDPTPVLSEIARVLQWEGRLIITVPSDFFHHYLDIPRKYRAQGQMGLAAAYNAAIDARLEHYHYHTPQEWAELFGRCGLELVDQAYYMAPAAAATWDRLNYRYGVSRRSWFSILVSPRFRRLGYQSLLARWLPGILQRRLNPYYEMGLSAGEKGAGLLLVAQKTG